MASKNIEEDVEKVRQEKLKALEATLGNIEKSFGKGSIMRLGDNKQEKIDSISTGSIGLDYALGIGGMPRGRIIEVFGPESSGKTTLALHVIAEAQKLGGIGAFIDAEHAFDRFYAKKLGVDIENLVYYHARWIVEQNIKEGKLVYPGKPKINPKETLYGIQQ